MLSFPVILYKVTRALPPIQYYSALLLPLFTDSTPAGLKQGVVGGCICTLFTGHVSLVFPSIHFAVLKFCCCSLYHLLFDTLFWSLDVLWNQSFVILAAGAISRGLSTQSFNTCSALNHISSCHHLLSEVNAVICG